MKPQLWLIAFSFNEVFEVNNFDCNRNIPSAEGEC